MLEHSEQLDALGAALAKAQAQVKGAVRDSENPHFRSRYADLASVWEACRDALTRNGFSVVQLPGYADGVATLDTMLLHSSGQWIRGTAGAPLAKQDAQGVGSALTYLRRYALAAVASVAPEDDDGEGAVSRPPTQERPVSRPANVTADGVVVATLPFGSRKGTPLADLTEQELKAARDWARNRGKFLDFVEAADHELGRRAVAEP